MAQKKASVVEEKKEFITKEQFEAAQKETNEGIIAILEMVKGIAEKKPVLPATAEEILKEKEIKSVDAEYIPVNPAWEAKVREIIGEAVDRIEMAYPKNGGTLFTVIIKKEFSNASPSYMQMMKEDRRTREIGNGGIQEVEQWAKLIRQNINRPKN